MCVQNNVLQHMGIYVVMGTYVGILCENFLYVVHKLLLKFCGNV